MKKRIAAVLVLLFLCSLLTSCTGSTVSYQEHLEDYVKTMDYHDGFTILQLGDIHWSSGTQVGDDAYGQERYLRKVIAEAEAHAGHIDLIEITGDTFMLATRKDVTSFLAVMEDIGIPYATTWGNHDRQGKYNPNWISEQFLTAAHSLYTEVDNDDVHERSNYVINLMNSDGSVAWQLIQLDSGASYRKSATDLFLTYDYLRDDQFSWLSAEHALVGDDVPALCYYHIAQGDAAIAYEAIASGDTSYQSAFFKLEGMGASKYCTTTEEVFLANNVKGVFRSHVHANDWTFTTPSGIVYGFGVKTGTELYYGQVEAGDTTLGEPLTEGFSLSGASLVTLTDTTGSFTLEHLYLNERDGGDFVMWVEY